MIRVTRTRSIVAAGIASLLGVGYWASSSFDHADSPMQPWIYGNVDSRFTVVLYADLKCPYCRDYLPVLLSWIDAHADVRLQWHHRPLEVHEPSATKEAVQAECVGRLGGSKAFWLDVARHFNNTKYVAVGSAAMDECLSNGVAAAWVQTQVANATADGIAATPTLRLIDGQTGKTLTLEGPAPGDALLSALDLLLSPAESTDQHAGSEAETTSAQASRE